MFSLRGGTRTDLYTCLVAPPSLFDLEKGLCVYTYGYSTKTSPWGFKWKTEKILDLKYYKGEPEFTKASKR